MILHHKDLNIDKKLIKFKKGFKYTDNISFVPIFYNKKEIILQSPNMYIPFDVIKYKENIMMTLIYIELLLRHMNKKRRCCLLKNTFLLCTSLILKDGIHSVCILNRLSGFLS